MRTSNFRTSQTLQISGNSRKTLENSSQLSLLGEETATIGMSLSNATWFFRVFAGVRMCICMYSNDLDTKNPLRKERFADQNAHKNRQQHPKALDDYSIINNCSIWAVCVVLKCLESREADHKPVLFLSPYFTRPCCRSNEF